MAERIGAFVLLVGVSMGISLVLAGCSGTKETSGTNEFFFQPVDTLRQMQGRGQQAVPGGGNIPQGDQQQAAPRKKDATEELLISQTAVDTITPKLRFLTSIPELKDSIQVLNEDLRLLQTLLEGSTLDPRTYFHSQVKAWIINNQSVRDSLFYALMAVDSSIQAEAGAEAEVLATEGDDIIQVRFGTTVFKGVHLKEAIEKFTDPYLYKKIIRSSSYSKDIELRDTTFRLSTPFESELLASNKILEEFNPLTHHTNPEPTRFLLTLSLYGAGMRIGPDWGGEVRLGNDEIGFPFWSTGNLAVLAVYRHIKFGIQLPLALGKNSGAIFPSVDVPGRLLNGSRGLTSEFDFGHIGGMFTASTMSKRDISMLVNPDRFFFIPTIMLVYYSMGFTVGPSDMARMKIGLSYHQVRQGRVIHPSGGDSDITEDFRFDYFSPYLKFEYSHEGADEQFGGSMQYNHYTLLGTVWLQIVPKIFRIEVKYARPVASDISEWQNSDFITISPQIRIAF